MTRRSASLLLVLALGCSEKSMDVSQPTDDRDVETDDGDTGLDLAPPRLFWLRVEPTAADVDGSPLAPHTFGPFLSGDGFELVLSPTVTLSGRATGERILGWSAAPLPSETVPAPGELRLEDLDVGDSWRTSVGEDGRFEIAVNPGVHSLELVPDDPSLPPLRRAQPVWEDLDLDLSLTDGRPLWGRIVDARGQGIAGASVWAEAPEGTATAMTTTDEEGWYLVRVDESVWRVATSGPADGREPVLRTPADDVAPEGRRVDLTYANAPRAALTMRVTSPAGSGLRGIPVRLTSTRLDDYGLGAASYSIEAVTDSRGFLDARVPDGIYNIEVAPADDQLWGALLLDDEPIRDETDLGSWTIAPRVEQPLSVLDEAGAPVEGAVVRCTEELGRGRSAEATTGAGGIARLPDAPRPPMDCVVAPPSSRPALAPLRVRLAEGDLETPLELSVGEPLRGRVLVEDATVRTALDLALVRLLDEDRTPLDLVLSDADGRFEIRVPRDR